MVTEEATEIGVAGKNDPEAKTLSPDLTLKQNEVEREEKKASSSHLLHDGSECFAGGAFT